MEWCLTSWWVCNKSICNTTLTNNHDHFLYIVVKYKAPDALAISSIISKKCYVRNPEVVGWNTNQWTAEFMSVGPDN